MRRRLVRTVTVVVVVGLVVVLLNVTSGLKLDDIRTAAFPPVDLGDGEYFVVGDNRSASPDSRSFGPVQEDAIYACVLLVLWPAGDFGRPESRHPGPPPGRVSCS
jgi:hypothetical protein